MIDSIPTCLHISNLIEHESTNSVNLAISKNIVEYIQRQKTTLPCLDFSNTQASGRAIAPEVGEERLKEVWLIFQRGLERLYMNNTKASLGLLCRYKCFPALKEASFDNCKNIAENQVELNNFQFRGVHKALETLSLIGSYISIKVRNTVLPKCFPSLKTLLFTLQPQQERLIGISDPITLSTIEKPHVLVPCGHILSQIGVQLTPHNRCCCCRTGIEKVIPIQSWNVKLTRQENRWNIEYLDNEKNVVDFNKPIFMYYGEKQFISNCAEQTMPHIRIFPMLQDGPDLEERNFNSLHCILGYSTLLCDLDK